MTCCIYKIKNLINQKVYIGKTVDFISRRRRHIRSLLMNSHKNQHLQMSWNKYGPESFLFEIIEICDRSKLNERECFWIKELQSTDRSIGYNKMTGGDGGALTGDALTKMVRSRQGFIMPESTRHKISAKLLGHTVSSFARGRISRAQSGKPKSPNHRAKLSASLLGRVIPGEVRDKMSKSRRGRPQTKIACPHCNMVGGTAMYRWHFDKCKEKT